MDGGDQYREIHSAVAADGRDHWFEERQGRLLLVERVDEYLTVEWLYLPEREWFRAMFRDRRRVPLDVGFQFAAPRKAGILGVGISNRGMKDGWTTVAGGTPPEAETAKAWSNSLGRFREVVVAEAQGVSAEVTAVLGESS